MDVFFLDLRMPTMDGMELCRRIKQLRPSAHVFALSAYVGAYSEEELCDAGFNACFSKPFKLDELLEVCTRAFGEQE